MIVGETLEENIVELAVDTMLKLLEDNNIELCVENIDGLSLVVVEILGENIVELAVDTMLEILEDKEIEIAVDKFLGIVEPAVENFEVNCDNVNVVSNDECKVFVVVLIVEPSVLVSMNFKNVFCVH